MRLSDALRDEIVAHAVRDAPDECCGVVVARDGEAVAVHQLENTAHSPLRFEVDGLTLHRILTDSEDADLQLAAIYHSHTRSDPYPSQTDINFAQLWPGVEWIIVGVAGDGEPLVRSYLIEGGRVEECALETA